MSETVGRRPPASICSPAKRSHHHQIELENSFYSSSETFYSDSLHFTLLLTLRLRRASVRLHLKNKSLLAAPFIHLLMLLLLFSKKISAKMCFPNIELGLICYVFKLKLWVKVHNPHSTLTKKRCVRNLQLSLLTTMLMVMMMAVMKEEWERWAQATNEAMRR